MNKLKPKEPLIALLLTVLIPGLGHVYSGKENNGIKYFSVLILLPLILFLYVTHPLTTANFGIGYILIAIFLFLVGLNIFVLIDSYKCAKSFNKHHNIELNTPKLRKIWIIVCIIFFMFIFHPSSLVGIYVKARMVKAFKIPTESMKPTLIEGDRLLVNKAIYRSSEPKRGDIIVFKYPDKTELAFLSRVAGLPGESLEIKGGKLVINDKTIKSFVPNGGYFNTGDYGQSGQVIKIPQGKYFVLGDNTLNSRDSRYYGFVPKENLIGKAYKIYYPFDRSGAIKREI